MSRTIHKELVERIVRRYGATTHGFKQEMIRLCEESDPAEVARMRIVPDAYTIGRDDEGGTVTVYEVCVTSAIGHNKFDWYTWLWFELDGVDIELRLIAVDRFGKETRLDLTRRFYDGVYSEKGGKFVEHYTAEDGQ